MDDDSGDDCDGEYEDDEDDFSEDEESGNGRKRKRAKAPKGPTVYVEKNRPNFYGAVPGVEIGRIWETRMACSHDGVQRPPVAGIHGGNSNNKTIHIT